MGCLRPLFDPKWAHPDIHLKMDDYSRAGDADGERVGGCGRAGSELLGDESTAERKNGDTRPDENENGGDEDTVE